MEFACELIHSGKAFHTMVCNRLIVVCHEDLDTLAAPVSRSSRIRSRHRKNATARVGEARLMIATASG